MADFDIDQEKLPGVKEGKFVFPHPARKAVSRREASCVSLIATR